jgi:hypothetical protein
VFTSGVIGLVAYPGWLDDEDILADGAGYDPERSVLILDATLGCLTGAGAPEGEAVEMPFPINSAVNWGLETAGDGEDNEDNEECAEVTLIDVLFDVSFDVLVIVLFIMSSIVLLVVLAGSTLRAWKTITLSWKWSKSPTLVVSDGKPEPRHRSMLEGASSLPR